MSRWNEIRAFYRAIEPAILAESSAEWAVDPYEWDASGLIQLTPIERWLWHDIRAVDVVLYPQYPVGRFFVDFANPVARVAIECDGAEFHKDRARDEARDQWLRERGWSVYRISGRDCRDGVGSESPSQSEARQFIQRIASMHMIERRFSPRLGGSTW